MCFIINLNVSFVLKFNNDILKSKVLSFIFV